MKINKIISLVLGFTAVAVSSCIVMEQIDNTINTPELNPGEYIRLTLTGGDGSKAIPSEGTRAIWDDPNGKGSLGFMWEQVDLNAPETDRLTLIVSNGTSAISSHESAELGASEAELPHTGLAVTPSESDAHFANFETVRYYSTDDLKQAKYFYAVAGYAEITADAEKKQHTFRLDMPSKFTQVEDQNPSFLRDYMHMYATAAYDGNSSKLNFNHIPATFRFIISNGGEDAVTIQSVSVKTLDGSAVASRTTDVTFGWDAGNAALSYDAEGYSVVTTMLSENGVIIEKGKKYTAYTMAMPLAGNDPFKGKALNFNIKSSNGEVLSSILDGETLAKANGGDIYNWVGGKSYTIKINIGEGGKATGAVLTNKDITVASNIEETYTLKYVNSDGEPLANYADICTLTIDQMITYEDFIDVNVAPYSADAIGIFDAVGVKVGSIVLNGIKADNAGLLYSIGMLSDVHIGVDTAIDDFTNALNFFNSADVNAEFTCICGDISENRTETEFAKYQEIVAGRPVYTTTGNHDCPSSGTFDEALWKRYTGQDLTFELSRPLANGRTDHYLFLGMSNWNFTNAYTESNIKWLENKLEEYRNERCFVITHLFFPDRAGNLLNIYPSYNWLAGVQLNTLQAMCDRYKNSIWFSGHSHWKWSLQQYEDHANICRNPESGWSVHIPSCAKPIDSDGTSREDRYALSEGAVLNVYENHIDLLGVDFINRKYLPVATYRLDTTLQEVEEREEEDVELDETYLTASDFVWNPEKKPLETPGVGTASITDVDGMPGYIDVIFTSVSQGWYMTNSTYTPGVPSPAQTVNITIEDLQYWTGWGTNSQTQVNSIAKVGFYSETSGSYNLETNDICDIQVKTEPGKEGQGVQFQTSSSCPGPFPIKLRMKARAQFHTEEEPEEEPKDYISAENFSTNSGKEKGGSYTNVAGMPNYVDVTFTAKSQGFYITNSTHTSSTRNATVTIEDAKALSDGVEVPMPGKVGFYQDTVNGASSAYLMENKAITLKDGNGLPFQISSSYSGPLPITIRMKVEVEFY